MGWRAIPIVAALGVLGVARILYDPMPSSAPAAVATNTDNTTDLSQVDFTPWLTPTTVPTTAPTTEPVSDHPSDQPDTIEQSAAASADHLLTFFRRIAVEKFQWNGVANQPLVGIPVAAAPFATPAIDLADSSSQNFADFTEGYTPSGSSNSRNRSPEPMPVEPLSDTITSANDPAFSIVGFDIPENTPLPETSSDTTQPPSIIALPPPIPAPEPGTGAMLLLIATLAMKRSRQS